MRFTTKLSALITLLVALAMFLMLMGCSYSFFYVTQDRQERRFDSLVTSLDQAMLQESPRDQEKWLPIVMRPLGIVSIRVEAGPTEWSIAHAAIHRRRHAVDRRHGGGFAVQPALAA